MFFPVEMKNLMRVGFQSFCIIGYLWPVFLRGLMVKSACFGATTGSEGVGSNPTPEHNIVRAHGTLNGGGLYPVFYAGATERSWTSLNE